MELFDKDSKRKATENSKNCIKLIVSIQVGLYSKRLLYTLDGLHDDDDWIILKNEDFSNLPSY